MSLEERHDRGITHRAAEQKRNEISQARANQHKVEDGQYCDLADLFISFSQCEFDGERYEVGKGLAEALIDIAVDIEPHIFSEVKARCGCIEEDVLYILDLMGQALGSSIDGMAVKLIESRKDLFEVALQVFNAQFELTRRRRIGIHGAKLSFAMATFWTTWQPAIIGRLNCG